MYKIMIIDDEAYFREYLKTTIPWQNYELEICGEAGDGKEGLNKIPEVKPDIILADINMPVINGLTFSKQVKKQYPHIYIILITGYNEFEYARQALKVGVSNYISKPLDKQELIDSLLAIKSNIKDRKDRDFYITKLQKQFDETVPVLKNNILYDAVKGMYSNKYEQLLSDLKAIDLSLPDTPFVITVIEPDIISNTGLSDREMIKNKISSIATNIIDNSLLFSGGSNRVIMIVKVENPRKMEFFKSRCNEIVIGINNELGLSAAIGIGIICSDIKDMPVSFEKAGIALKNKFLLGDNKVIEFESLKIGESGKEVFPFKLKNDLLMYMRLTDSSKVNDTFSDIYNFLKSKPLQIDYIYIIYTELMSSCLSYISEYGYDTAEIFGVNFRPFETIISKNTMNEVHTYVSSLYNRLIQYLNNDKKVHSARVVSKAKEYIDCYYYKSDLLIDEIAANVFFHPSYLRFLFKKETGITIGDYLTQVRMTKAVELLKSGRKNCAEVACMVGYSDATYFSKCFKKYYNICPSEYEKVSGHSNS